MNTELWTAYMAVIGVLGELVDRIEDRDTLALLDKALGLAEAFYHVARVAELDAVTGRLDR